MFVLLLVAFLAVLTLPGWGLLRVLGFRGMGIVLVAPPVSLAILGVLGVGLNYVGIRWGWLPIAVVIALIWVVVFLFQLVPPLARWRRRRGSESLSGGLSIGGIPRALTIAFCWLIFVLPIAGAIKRDSIINGVDAVFHYNGAWTIATTGNASTLNALTSLYGIDAGPRYYPALWHAIVALSGTENIVIGVNALLILTVLLLLAGISELARLALPGLNGADILAPVATLLVGLSFHQVIFSYPIWPNALAGALLPATMALLLSASRRLRERRDFAQFFRWGGASGLSTLGLILAHPSSLFSLALLILPGIFIVAGRKISHWIGPQVWKRATATVLALVVLTGGVYALRLSGKLSFMLDRQVEWSRLPLVYNVYRWLRVWPGAEGGILLSVYLVLACVAVSGGVYLLLRHRFGSWILGAWATTLIFEAATSYPIPILSGTTGLWYGQSLRIALVCVIPSALVITVALAHMRDRVVIPLQLRWSKRGAIRRAWATLLVSAMVAVIAGGLVLPTRHRATAEAFDRSQVSPSTMFDISFMRLLQRAKTKLPSGAVVLGDPQTGAAFFQAVSGKKVVFPQIAYDSFDRAGGKLRSNFIDWKTDRNVCELARRYGITHVFLAPVSPYAVANSTAISPGLYGVPVGQGGFEKVDSASNGVLYRFTGCAR